MSLLVSGGLALGSAAVKVFGSNRREDEINEAQRRKEASDRVIRAEQAGRIRRKQVKQGREAIAQAEAIKAAGGTSSGASNAVAGVQANVATNIGDMNTDLATGNINAAHSESIQNAGRPSDFELFNEIASPLINAGLSYSIANAFSKPAFAKPAKPAKPT